MISEKKRLLKGIITMGMMAVACLSGNVKGDAATLTANEDLRGYDAVIETKNGGNVLTTKKGSWDLNEDTKIFSSRSLKIYLNNTDPVKIDAIYSKGSLEFRGKGEIVADTDGEFGINVDGYLKVFKYTKYGVGKVVGKGTESGVRAYNEIQMEGGTLEGYGQKYGIWTYNDIKPYFSAKIKAVASAENSIGIWAYRDIYAWKGATVYGEGEASGAYTHIAHIQAEHGGTIKGVSRNINSPLSALHAQKQMLRAYHDGKVIEEYVLNRQETSKWRPYQPVAITNYGSIKRNMNDFQKYSWNVLGNSGSVTVTPEGLKLSSMRKSTIEGIRPIAVDSEPTKIKANGVHIVRLTDVTLGGF